MTTTEALDIDTVFPSVPESVAAVRRFVAIALARADVNEDWIEDACLLVSELASNVLLHTDSPIRVRVLATDELIRVEVGDNTPEPADMWPDSIGLFGGRGLQIVDTLASRWSSVPTARGKIVWFELGETSRLGPHIKLNHVSSGVVS